jgi:hypothetical protein
VGCALHGIAPRTTLYWTGFTPVGDLPWNPGDDSLRGGLFVTAALGIGSDLAVSLVRHTDAGEELLAFLLLEERPGNRHGRQFAFDQLLAVPELRHVPGQRWSRNSAVKADRATSSPDPLLRTSAEDAGDGLLLPRGDQVQVTPVGLLR